MKIKKLNKGFTLIELLVVIGILAILLAITLIAINPARQFGQSNDTKRKSDVNAILSSISQYQVDPANAGTPPAGLTFAACPSTTPCTITNDATVSPRADICSALVTKYIAALPQDPKFNGGDSIDCSGTYNAHYLVGVSASPDSRVTVTAPSSNTYSGVAITVTR